MSKHLNLGMLFDEDSVVAVCGADVAAFERLATDLPAGRAVAEVAGVR